MKKIEEKLPHNLHNPQMLVVSDLAYDIGMFLSQIGL